MQVKSNPTYLIKQISSKNPLMQCQGSHSYAGYKQQVGGPWELMIRFLYNPIDLLCIQVSTLPFILKNLCKKV